MISKGSGTLISQKLDFPFKIMSRAGWSYFAVDPTQTRVTATSETWMKVLTLSQGVWLLCNAFIDITLKLFWGGGGSVGVRVWASQIGEIARLQQTVKWNMLNANVRECFCQSRSLFCVCAKGRSLWDWTLAPCPLTDWLSGPACHCACQTQR